MTCALRVGTRSELTSVSNPRPVSARLQGQAVKEASRFLAVLRFPLRAFLVQLRKNSSCSQAWSLPISPQGPQQLPSPIPRVLFAERAPSELFRVLYNLSLLSVLWGISFAMCHRLVFCPSPAHRLHRKLSPIRVTCRRPQGFYWFQARQKAQGDSHQTWIS